MADSFAQIIIHITFHTKSGGVTIREEHLPRVYEYVGGEIRSLKGTPMCIGGRPDHLHILCTLPKTIALSEFLMNIKKGCSKWIKGIDPAYRLFAWQDGYGAFSVSYSMVEKTVNYIAHQAEHHKKKGFKDEFKAFLAANGIEYDEKYL